ncbi:sigma-70 family RNA polymerase sigma factor [Anaerolineales bacterium]
MNRKDEKRLVQDAKKGDREAFAALYQANVDAIFHYILMRTNRKEIAEELTSDVFVRAIKGLSRYEDRGQVFRAWLYRIAHARVIDYYRREDRRPQETSLEIDLISIKPDMDQGLLKREISQILTIAISDLTDDQQEVIILRFVEGLALSEVAVIMGKETNAIKALQHRALNAISKRLARQGVDIKIMLEGLL